MISRFTLFAAVACLASACAKKVAERPDAGPGATTVEVPEDPAPPPPSTPEERAMRDALAGLDGEGEPFAIIETSVGSLECRLHAERTPLTVANFIGLSRGTREWRDPDSGAVRTRPLYRDLPFHRIEPGFLVETGDPTGTGDGGPGYELPDEFHPELRHDSAGVLSMSSHGPDTAGSQFFVLLAEAPHLDGRHTVFGECRGSETLAALRTAKADDTIRLEQIRIALEPAEAQ